MNNIYPRLPFSLRYMIAALVFMLAFCILPSAFLYEKGGRVLFYLCSYLSVIGLCVAIKKDGFKILNNKLALSLLLLGSTFILWSVYSGYTAHEDDELLYTAGKRCFLAFMIISYIFYSIKNKILNTRIIKEGAIFSIAIAFTLASLYAFIQAAMATEPEALRVVLGINRATVTAYAYSALSIALMALVLELTNDRLRKAIFFTVAFISLYVILLTQTRSAIAIHLLLIAYLTYRLFVLSKNYKFIAILAIALIICATLASKIIENRLETTVQEISLYQKGDDKTSLGSRFTMWKTGILSFEHAPFGQSVQDRNAFIKSYLYANQQADSFALEYIDVHLHNEFIQYASVFGVCGILVLLYFYWTNIFARPKGRTAVNAASLVTVSTLLYGSTDVLMTSIEYIVIYAMLMTMLLIISGCAEEN